MAYLVTGADGFLGRAVVRRLLADGLAVVATDISEPADLPDLDPRHRSPLSRVAYDVCLGTAPPELLGPFEAIVHAAAQTLPDGDPGDASRLREVNVDGAANVVALARFTATPKLVHVSSSGVYRRSLAGPLREPAADGGDTLYGATKLAAELVVIEACEQAGIALAILRPCSLYGPGEAPRPSRPVVSPVWHLARAAAAGRSVQLTRTASRREWLAVEDAAAAVAMALQAPSDGPARVLNVGTGILTDLGTLASLAGVRIDDDNEDVEAIDGGDDWAGFLDTAEIGRCLGWSPEQTLGAGLAAYVDALVMDGEPYASRR